MTYSQKMDGGNDGWPSVARRWENITRLRCTQNKEFSPLYSLGPFCLYYTGTRNMSIIITVVQYNIIIYYKL